MKKAPLMLASAILLALSACDNPLADPMGDAAQAYAKQDYFAARDGALAALRENSDDADALALLARSQIAVGDGENALTTIERLERLPQKPADIKLLRAEASLQVGDVAAMNSMLEGNDSAEAWRMRALAAGLDNNEAGVFDAFRRGRAASGEKVRLYAAEASYFLARDDANGAREAVGLAQQAGPTRLETMFITARLAQIDGNSDIASRAYLAILDISPNDRPALLGAIAELGKLERIDLLRPLVARGRQAFPGDREFAFLEARLKAQDGDWQGARDLLQRREADLASHPESRGLYAEALLNLGQLEAARTQITPLYRAMPDNAQITRVYARVELELGNKAEAARAIAPLAGRADALEADAELAARASQS